MSEERAVQPRSRHESARDAAPARTRRAPRAPAGTLDDALLAVQHLAGNAAVADALARQQHDAHQDGPAPLVPELSETSRLVLRLPGQAADLLTTERPSARARKRTVVRLEGVAGSGGRATAPVTVATSARGALLTGTLEGLQPLAFDHPLTGVVATLTPDVAFALRVGRVDLAGGGNEASVSIGDGVVTLAVQFAAGMVRLTGEVGSAGEAPDDWDIEVELDQRRCSRLLSRRPRSAGSRSADTVASPPPPDDPRRRSSRSGRSANGAEPAGDPGSGSDTGTEASRRRPQG